MKVLVIASQKGGVGKTTLSGHLAIEAEAVGQERVAIIDTDPQGSLSKWWNKRKAETPLFATVDVAKLKEQLNILKEKLITLVIIDTPPAVTDIITTVIKIADVVLIPTKASPHDLEAIASTIDIVESVDKKMVFVLNGCIPRSKITAQAVFALSQYGKVAPVVIHNRIDFITSMIDGRTVQEISRTTKASQEIIQLWAYLSNQFKKSA
jgi:chromosome partitioning protein